MRQVKILGINDDVTTCECCGRAGLKKTVVLEINESQVHFGTDCASKALRFGVGAKMTAAKIAKEAELSARGSSYAFRGSIWIE